MAPPRRQLSARAAVSALVLLATAASSCRAFSLSSGSQLQGASINLWQAQATVAQAHRRLHGTCPALDATFANLPSSSAITGCDATVVVEDTTDPVTASIGVKNGGTTCNKPLTVSLSKGPLTSAAPACPTVTRTYRATCPCLGIDTTETVTNSIVPSGSPTITGITFTPAAPSWKCAEEAKPAVPAVTATAKDGCQRTLSYSTEFDPSSFTKTEGVSSCVDVLLGHFCSARS